MVVVGVNRFVQPDDQTPTPNAQTPSIESFRVDPEMERGQIERLRAVRAGRSRDSWQAAIAGVESAARDGSNLVPPIIAAVEARATLGEIADAMRRVFGEHQEI
jgi:methylmalonyl-CoA mutase N-terminal domain/subunit